LSGNDSTPRRKLKRASRRVGNPRTLDMSYKTSGLRVVVLGGSFGLGLAVAKDDAPQNATGVIASKQKHRIEEALGQLPAPPAAKRLISPTRQQMAPLRQAWPVRSSRLDGRRRSCAWAPQGWICPRLLRHSLLGRAGGLPACLQDHSLGRLDHPDLRRHPQKANSRRRPGLQPDRRDGRVDARARRRACPAPGQYRLPRSRQNAHVGRHVACRSGGLLPVLRQPSPSAHAVPPFDPLDKSRQMQPLRRRNRDRHAKRPMLNSA
jgi:hypothetical protein